jgi:hypothetical protein
MWEAGRALLAGLLASEPVEQAGRVEALEREPGLLASEEEAGRVEALEREPEEPLALEGLWEDGTEEPLASASGELGEAQLEEPLASASGELWEAQLEEPLASALEGLWEGELEEPLASASREGRALQSEWAVGRERLQAQRGVESAQETRGFPESQ